MKHSLLFLSLFCTGGLVATAGTCGTLALPTSCVLDVNNQVRYTFSNFNLVNSFATGGGPTIGGAEVKLTTVSGGGLSGVLQVSKVVTTANPNVVFLANSGATSGFSFSYDVAITPLTPGTVLFINPAVDQLDTSSFSGNGQANVQLVLPGAPTCLATALATQANCTLPAGTTTTLSSGDLVGLFGNTGNAPIGQFSNIFNASFTAAPTGVPEPSTFALLGLGLAVISRLRRR